MAVAVVQHKETSNALSVVLNANATSGNILVLILNHVGGTAANKITAVSGVAGTWTKAISVGQGGAGFNARLEIWVGTGLTAATTVTLTSDGYVATAITLQELSGNVGGILGTSVNSGTGTSTDTGSLTPTGTTGRVLIAGIAVTSFGSPSGGVTDSPAAFTNLNDTTNGSITKIQNTGYREPTSTSAASRAQAWTSMDSWVGGMVELGPLDATVTGVVTSITVSGPAGTAGGGNVVAGPAVSVTVTSVAGTAAGVANASVTGVHGAVTLASPAGSPFSALSANVTGVKVTITLTARAGSTGVVVGPTASVTVTAPAGVVESFVIDRTGARLQLAILDDHVPYQPGVVPCSVTDFKASEGSDFTIWMFLDDEPTSTFIVEVDPDTGVNDKVHYPVDDLAVGGHFLSLGNVNNAPDYGTSQPFIVDSSQTTTGADTPQYPPVVTSGNWTFQEYDFSDVMNILTYEFPINPSRLEESYAEPALSSEATTAYDGKFITWEGDRKPDRWTISGSVLDQLNHDALTYWADVNQRLWVTDEFGRTVLAKTVSLKMTRKRDMDRPWHHTYVMVFDVLSGPSDPTVLPSQYETVFSL